MVVCLERALARRAAPKRASPQFAAFGSQVRKGLMQTGRTICVAHEPGKRETGKRPSLASPHTFASTALNCHSMDLLVRRVLQETIGKRSRELKC